MLGLPNVETSGRFIHGIPQSPLAAPGFSPWGMPWPSLRRGRCRGRGTHRAARCAGEKRQAHLLPQTRVSAKEAGVWRCRYRAGVRGDLFSGAQRRPVCPMCSALVRDITFCTCCVRNWYGSGRARRSGPGRMEEGCFDGAGTRVSAK